MSLVQRVELRHDWGLTKEAMEGFGLLLPPRSVAQEIGLTGLRHGLRRARTHQPRGSSNAVTGSLAASIKAAEGMTGAAKRMPSMTALRSLWRASGFWNPDAAAGFAMTFPARVRLELADGRSLVAGARIPQGGAGHPSCGPQRVASSKLADWGPMLWGDETTAAIDTAIETDHDQLFDLLGRR